MTSNLWMLIATALGREDTGLDAAMVDPQAMASPGAAIHGAASEEEVEDAFPIFEPAWTPPPLVESFLAMFGFSSPSAGGALASECKCNVALTSDFLGPCC